MRNFLVVDDSAIIRKIASRMLSNRGFTVVEAEDGAAALKACTAAMPDGILLDWNMPTMDGVAFLRALRAEPNGLKPKVLFCTTESELEKITIALEAGADEFIMKPFDDEILASKLEIVGLG